MSTGKFREVQLAAHLHFSTDEEGKRRILSPEQAEEKLPISILQVYEGSWASKALQWALGKEEHVVAFFEYTAGDGSQRVCMYHPGMLRSGGQAATALAPVLVSAWALLQKSRNPDSRQNNQLDGMVLTVRAGNAAEPVIRHLTDATRFPHQGYYSVGRGEPDFYGVLKHQD